MLFFLPRDVLQVSETNFSGAKKPAVPRCHKFCKAVHSQSSKKEQDGPFKTAVEDGTWDDNLKMYVFPTYHLGDIFQPFQPATRWVPKNVSVGALITSTH